MGHGSLVLQIIFNETQIGIECGFVDFIEVFLNYQQNKAGISANQPFPFASFVTFIAVTDKFGGKCYLIFSLMIRYYKN